jgi:hypothetical protein
MDNFIIEFPVSFVKVETNILLTNGANYDKDVGQMFPTFLFFVF